MAEADRIVIRRARPGDAAAVRVLVEQLGYAPEERGYDETFAQVARHPEAAVFVAQLGARVVGYLAMSHRPQVRLGARVASVDELAVDELARGAGIGTALIEAALAHARGLHCARVDLLAARAQESYRRGFCEALTSSRTPESDLTRMRSQLPRRKRSK